jgi:nucleotide-binding universal stress UspA family protein
MKSPTPIVLIATSLTKASDQIVRNGVRIARAAGAKVHLVHAFDLTMLYSGAAMGGGAYLPEMIEGESAGHRERLQDQAWRLGIQRQELGGLTALEGAPHRVLVETAARTGASLIVMGAAESWGRLSKLLGSTADRVVRAAACPVLALRGELELPPRRVLIAVDLSPASGDAMLRGLEVLAAIGAGPSRRPRAAVEALYVAESPLLDAVLPAVDPPWVEAMAAEDAKDLERFIAAHLPEPGWQVSGQVRSARAADSEILGRCAEATPDLVVLGTHGRSGFERFLVGSVAESVMRHAQASVLIIPPLAAGSAAGAGARLEPAQAAVAGVGWPLAGGPRRGAAGREAERAMVL